MPRSPKHEILVAKLEHMKIFVPQEILNLVIYRTTHLGLDSLGFKEQEIGNQRRLVQPAPNHQFGSFLKEEKNYSKILFKYHHNLYLKS